MKKTLRETQTLRTV